MTMVKMKYLLLTFMLFLLSCNNKKEAAELTDKTVIGPASIEIVPPKLLIVPAKSIGNISLNQNASELESILGQPDLSDAAMGKAWLTWFSKISDSITGNELNIYTTYKPNDPNLTEKIVRQIRITSPEFKTSNNISTSNTLSEIKIAFPNVAEIGKYDLETENPVIIYDDVASGIAFEIENDSCTGIIIQEKDKSVGKEYISFHPDMKPM